MIGIKRARVQVLPSDPRVRISPCCKYPVETRTTTDEHTKALQEASDGKAAGKTVKFDRQGAIYGQCQKCGEAVVRVRVLESRIAPGLPYAVVEVWDIIVADKDGQKGGLLQ